ncbi:MAG: tRNA (adenosine(37)-N6)-threonylcarbamoyltransferase complex ATPase subunit type 1 TsaE [Gammaproteobacteria bacterium]|nr:tRNA (adenosine(37)-N6)-threonylcarbamoyltransferase complex ATPase subunit type 1 TsaE [Gammaproteobacteria bacterium]
MKLVADTVREMNALGAGLARLLLDRQGAVIYLSGPLGAGKTTLARALLKTLGVQRHVHSPTYTLVEAYSINSRSVWHLDLYRLSDPEELEFLGLRDVDPGNDICLVEWPERGTGHLPPADVSITLEMRDPGRGVFLQAHSEHGTSILNELESLDLIAHEFDN